jgi:hypothetical protein
MYKQEAISFFTSQKKLAAALKVTSGAISHWEDVIPEKQALRLHNLTDGKLKYEPSMYTDAA